MRRGLVNDFDLTFGCCLVLNTIHDNDHRLHDDEDWPRNSGLSVGQGIVVSKKTVYYVSGAAAFPLAEPEFHLDINRCFVVRILKKMNTVLSSHGVAKIFWVPSCNYIAEVHSFA